MVQPPEHLDETGAGQDSQRSGFHVTLSNFSGPFDLLLTLIGQHKLDITDVALAIITDDFIAYVSQLRDAAMRDTQALDEMSEFLLVAATLLDLKAARLLPGGQVEDDTDIATLEARDLLFARLLQYRAYKRIAEHLAELMTKMEPYYPRTVGPDVDIDSPPPLRWRHTPAEFAALAQEVLQRPAPRPLVVGLGHIHAPAVSVREQTQILARRLIAVGSASWEELVADAESILVVIGRFLAVLELYCAGHIDIDQPQPLGEMQIRWSSPGTDPAALQLSRRAAPGSC